jgi:NADP-dependent 3-hydroxy acid dehydrogenase YdfG/acyl carrier protein
VGGKALMPGTGIGELVRAAAEHVYEGEAAEVVSLVLQAPLVLSEGGQRVQVVVREQDERWEAQVYSQPAGAEEGASWTLHASAEVRRLAGAAPAALDLGALRSRCSKVVEVEDAYEAAAATGLEYGPAFRGMRSVRCGSEEAVAEVRLPEGVEGAEAYGIHPALLDAALHASFGLALGRGKEQARPLLPFAIERLTVHEAGARGATVYMRRATDGEAGKAQSLDVMLADAQGRILVEVEGLRSRPLTETREVEPGVSHEVYVVEWPEALAPGPSPGTLLSGRWVVVGAEQDALAQAVEGRIAALVGACTRVDVSRLQEALPAEHVVCVWSGTQEGATEDAAGEALRVASEGLAVVQALVKQERAPRLWWVTRSAVAVTPGQPVREALGALWGLGRTVRREHPELGCRLVDVETGGAEAEAVLHELPGRDDETEVAWRSGQRRVARLVRAPAADGQARELRTDGTVLITGGLGELGLHVGRWFASRGMKHLVLTGRRGKETPGASEAVAELQGMGAQVTVAAVDVTDRKALAGVLAAIPKEYPLRGVVHTAGVLDDGVLLEQNAERVSLVMSPKVKGACHLDALTRSLDLDVFVMFSSIAGTLGSAGQGPYAAANAFLNALAAKRHAERLPAQSLAWSIWTDAEGKAAGMASGLDRAQQARAVRGGVEVVSPAKGMALFEAALRRPEPQLMPVPLNLRQMRKSFEGTVPPLWRGLVQVPKGAAKARGKKGAWARELGALAETERMAAVLHVVRTEVARVLALSGPEAVAVERPLKELGLDSLTAVELRNALGKRADATLPATLAFDYPTPAAITKFLLKNLQGPKQSEDADDLLKVIESLDARVAILGRSDEHKLIMDRLVAIAARWMSASSSHGMATLPQEQRRLTDEELFGMIEQQAAVANLLPGDS